MNARAAEKFGLFVELKAGWGVGLGQQWHCQCEPGDGGEAGVLQQLSEGELEVNHISLSIAFPIQPSIKMLGHGMKLVLTDLCSKEATAALVGTIRYPLPIKAPVLVTQGIVDRQRIVADFEHVVFVVELKIG